MEEYIIDPLLGTIVFVVLLGVIGMLIFWNTQKQKKLLEAEKKEKEATATFEANKEARFTLTKEKEALAEQVRDLTNETKLNTGNIARLQTQNAHLEQELELNNKYLLQYKETIDQKDQTLQNQQVAERALRLELQTRKIELAQLSVKQKETDTKLEEFTTAFHSAKTALVEQQGQNEVLRQQLSDHKKQVEELNGRFQKEFENVANKILEEKTAKFTQTNQVHLEAILKPLGENLSSFKQKVEEVYDRESKERFSLGEKVKDLVQLNEKLSQEANNLTNALRSDSKAQGCWGEMILENILEQSGLNKDQEYFLENYLKDEHGNYLLSDDGKKMRPDAIIKYPDNRKVIIDSKVSLRAYMNNLDAVSEEEQTQYLNQHVSDLKTHINSLSRKGYERHSQSLDFVMMFVPNEPAYMMAIKHDSDLWHYAYERRILLISPTNLIASLKLISDLWSREYQNLNAQKIVDRGEKLYHKFVGFAENFKKVGKSLELAQTSYNDAYKQLATGNDNLVRQAEKLKELRINTKKNIPFELLEESES